MAVLHELREQMRELVPTLGHVLPEGGYGKMVTLRALDVFHALDAFEAAHPLLHECEDPIECHECKGKFPACSWTEEWVERELMLRNGDGEIDDHEFVPVCPACAKASP